MPYLPLQVARWFEHERFLGNQMRYLNFVEYVPSRPKIHKQRSQIRVFDDGAAAREPGVHKKVCGSPDVETGCVRNGGGTPSREFVLVYLMRIMMLNEDDISFTVRHGIQKSRAPSADLGAAYNPTFERR